MRVQRRPVDPRHVVQFHRRAAGAHELGVHPHDQEAELGEAAGHAQARSHTLQLREAVQGGKMCVRGHFEEGGLRSDLCDYQTPSIPHFFLTRVCSYFLLQCCDFPSLPVKTRLYDADSNGESSGENTVAEVAGEMCKDFED